MDKVRKGDKYDFLLMFCATTRLIEPCPPLDGLASLYVKDIVRLHGVPVSIVLYMDTRFTSMFWRSLKNALGTQLKFSIAFNP